jgi:hypothetical protein
MTLHDDSYNDRWVELPTDPVFQNSGSVACR